MNNKPKLVVIIGQTASGKSDLAVFLAHKFSGEIISADSRQVYKYMNIGTGKISQKAMRGIPHHLLNVAHPSRQFTVVQYKKKAQKIITYIQNKGKIPILVGGTGFYIQAIIDNIDFPEVPANKVLRSMLRNISNEELFKKLKKLDPRRAKNIDPKNKRRIIRALEIIEDTDKSVPVMRIYENPMDVLIIGINIERDELVKRIKKRLDTRFNEGMIKEIKNLHKKYRVSWKRLENFGLEYKWIALYSQNKITKKEMEEKLFRDTKRYAKRQMTWFGKDKKIKWIQLKNLKQLQKEAEKLVKNFLV